MFLPTDLTDRVLIRDGLVVITDFHDLHLVGCVLEVEGPLHEIFITLQFLLIKQVHLRILRMEEDRCMRSWLPHRYQQVTRSDLTGGECTCGTHGLRDEGSFAAA